VFGAVIGYLRRYPVAAPKYDKNSVAHVSV